jgi:hypothetical protein
VTPAAADDAFEMTFYERGFMRQDDGPLQPLPNARLRVAKTGEITVVAAPE